jgi:competence protein ComFC
MTLAGLKQRPAYFLYKLFWNALDWVFPPSCGGCGLLGERWCDTCRSSVGRLDDPLCSRCGQKIILSQSGQDDTCMECQAVQPEYTALRSVCDYSGAARKAVIRLKFGRDIGLGEALSNEMIQTALRLNWPIDLVTCVPLSQRRRRERGYNQAAMLARPLAFALQRPFRPQALFKTHEAPSQVGLSARERHTNVIGVFKANESMATSRNILVVDDVTTTGSTMNACARALLDAGAQKVFGLTFARAGLADHNQVL